MMTAQAVTAGAAASAAVIGAVPIDFPDAVVLTTLETAMISKIAKIYCLDSDDDYYKK